jgi:hypothetical protein
MIGIDHNGMGDVVAVEGMPDVFRILLGKKFRRVHADDREGSARELLFDSAQDRQNMETVYSTVGPEIEDGHPSAQIPRYCKRPAGIQPGKAGQEFRTSNELLSHHHLCQKGITRREFREETYGKLHAGGGRNRATASLLEVQYRGRIRPKRKVRSRVVLRMARFLIDSTLDSTQLGKPGSVLDWSIHE